MQTSFQYDISRKNGFIFGDRGGGGLSMHGMCNRLRRTQALLVGGSSHKPPVSQTLPVDVVSCTLPLHEYMRFSQKNVGTSYVRQGGKHNPFSKHRYTGTAKLRKLKPSSASRITKENAERMKSNYARRKTHEGFNNWGGRGYDNFAPVEVTKTTPSGETTT